MFKEPVERYTTGGNSDGRQADKKKAQGTKKIRADEGQSAENSGEFTPEELEVIEHPNRNLAKPDLKCSKR